MSPLIFTLANMLWAILISLLIGAFFGRWIAREARQFLRPSLGELMMREAKERGLQVLRSMGLSNARFIGTETEEQIRRADIEDDDSKPEKLTVPELWTPPTMQQPADVQQHSEN